MRQKLCGHVPKWPSTTFFGPFSDRLPWVSKFYYPPLSARFLENHRLLEIQQLQLNFWGTETCNKNQTHAEMYRRRYTKIQIRMLA